MTNGFEKMDAPELREAADRLAVEVGENAHKKTVLKALEDNYVTFDMWVDDLKGHGEWTDEHEERFFDKPVQVKSSDSAEVKVEEEPEADTAFKDDEEMVLVKMTRKNYSFSLRGYKFTKAHPFVPVKESDVDDIVEMGGFQIATPRQVREYYS